MRIQFTKKEEKIFVKIAGDLNLETSEKFKRAMKKKLDSGERSFFLDFSKVTSINSSGIGIIIALYKELKALGGSLKIVGLVDHIYSMMTLVKLNKIIPMEKKE